jgi:hypothetical protein
MVLVGATASYRSRVEADPRRRWRGAEHAVAAAERVRTGRDASASAGPPDPRAPRRHALARRAFADDAA